MPKILIVEDDKLLAQELKELLENAGYQAYITKPYNPTILLLRIETILKRTQNEAQKLEYKNIKIDRTRSQIICKDKVIILSKNEFLMLEYLLKNQGKIVSREEIMSYLWESDEFVDDNTLTVNVSRLRSKLEEAELKNVIETRRGQGYILVSIIITQLNLLY